MEDDTFDPDDTLDTEPVDQNPYKEPWAEKLEDSLRSRGEESINDMIQDALDNPPNPK